MENTFARFSFVDAARWTGGTWDGSASAVPVEAQAHRACATATPVEAQAHRACAGVSTDSRKVAPGSLFIALRGASFDGHAFVAQALAAGAAAAMVREDFDASALPPSSALLRVADPNVGLSNLARGWRLACGATVVGVTGSAGKTTVKEMTAALLSTLGPTARTPGNFNNDIGLPLSLLSMPGGTRFGVFEAGISHHGEMVPLADTMRPDLAVVSCIAPVHLEAFGNLAAIADEKAGLLRALPPDGTAILPLDDSQYPLLRAACPCRVVTVALSDASADFFATEPDPAAGAFTAHRQGDADVTRIETGMPGEHNLRNALLAVAVARTLGVPWNSIAEAFRRGISRPPMRWQVSDLNGAMLINDAYNANPLSMEKALETLASQSVSGRRFAVLGDMLELGAPDEAELHRGVGRAAARTGLDALWLVGDRACRWIREGALEGGMRAARVTACGSCEEAAERVADLLRPGDAVLLKASRGLHFEQVEKTLRERMGNHESHEGHEKVLSQGSNGNRKPETVLLELRGIEAEGVLGVLPEERDRLRKVRVDVRMEGGFSKASETDDLSDTVDYRKVVERVRREVREHADGLIERLAHRIAEAALDEASPLVHRVTVRLEKPDPMPGLAAASVSETCVSATE